MPLVACNYRLFNKALKHNLYLLMWVNRCYKY